MAIILSKRRESAALIAARKLSRIVLSRYAFALATLALGGAAFGLGVLSGQSSEPVEPIIHAATAKAADAQDEAGRLSMASREIVSALLAHQRIKGTLPASLDELHPVYLAEAPAEGWTLEGQSLRYTVADESVCASLGIESSDVAPATDKGLAGLRCYRTNEGVVFAHRLVDEPAAPIELAQLEVRGEMRDRLLTWAIKSVEADASVPCVELPDSGEVLAPTTVSAVSGQHVTRFCIPSFPEEHEPIERVMSLTRGEGSLMTGGKSLGRTWSLQVSSAVCGDDQAQVAIRIKLGEQEVLPVTCQN